MKPVLALALVPAFAAAAALAQSAPQTPAPPPPGLHDPGVQARPAPAGTTLQPTRPAPIVSGQPLPEVTVRTQGEQTVQEYRRNGQLYMVVITPKNGIAQTYMVDPEGRLVDEHGQKPTRPVMYKVMEWGKSRPAPASSAGD
jgi:hypothetical protein